ncbi:MAG: pilus assembly protein [Candidatus Dormibacteraeota bacterium]|nr:pilus assembly protein [Candidatus Dormibacteraeota bacterium]
MREGADCGERRLRRRRTRSQATIEFAFVAPLFLVCFLASIDAGLWAVQNGAEVAAVEEAARLAAASGAAPVGAPPPDARTVTAAVTPQLQQALFATRIVPWTEGACPATPADAEAAIGARTVALCIEQRVPPACVTPAGSAGAPTPPYCTDTPTVSVLLVGHVASLVPPGFGLGGSGGEIPADIRVTTHTLRFAP